MPCAVLWWAAVLMLSSASCCVCRLRVSRNVRWEVFVTSGHGNREVWEYLQRWGSGDVDSTFVEVSSRKRDDLPGQQRETRSPILPQGEGTESLVWGEQGGAGGCGAAGCCQEPCSFLLLHLKFSCLVTLLWETGTDLLWNSCSSTSLTPLPLEVIFILKILQQVNC